MKKILTLVAALICQYGCIPGCKDGAAISMRNEAESVVHVSSNIKWYDNKNYESLFEFDLLPGESSGLLSTHYFSDEVGEVGAFVNNPSEAQITISSFVDGREVSKTWSLSDYNDTYTIVVKPQYSPDEEYWTYLGTGFFNIREYKKSTIELKGRPYQLFTYVIDEQMLRSWL